MAVPLTRCVGGWPRFLWANFGERRNRDVFDRYTWAGEVDVAQSTDTNLVIEGKPRTERKTYPLFPSVSDFR